MGAIPSRPLIAVLSNADIDARRQAESRSATLFAQQDQPIVSALAGHIKRNWDANFSAKTRIEDQIFRNLRQRAGEYDPEEVSEIRAYGGSEIFMMLTSEKCRAAESWLIDILMPPGDRAWGLDPSPIPDLPPAVEGAIIEQVMMEAAAAGWQINDQQLSERLLTLKTEAMEMVRDMAERMAERHEQVIADQLNDGGWNTAFLEFLWNFVTLPAGIIKGPIFRRRKQLSWATLDGGGHRIPVVKDVVRSEWENRSPLDIYPSPTQTTIDNGNLIDRYLFTRADLVALKGVRGYNEQAIDEILQTYATGTNSNQVRDEQRAQLEKRFNQWMDPEGKIEALNFWGSASGRMLNEWDGKNGKNVSNGMGFDPNEEYQIEGWQVGHVTFKAVINPDPLGRKPYYKTSFEKQPNSFWGRGLPELMRDCQRMCNGSARAMANNAAIACLTGDTIVYRNQKDRRGRSEITLSQMWETKHQHNSGLRRMKLRSLDMRTGEFVYNRVVDIVDNGVQPVFEIFTENGYRIKATGNHRFLDELGEWRHVRDFHPGMKIGVNGSVTPLKKTCLDCGAPVSKTTSTRCRVCAINFNRQSNIGVIREALQKHNLKQMADAAENRDALATSARGRKACRDALLPACERCGDDYRLQVHHKDRDPWNNDRANLETLCDGCHKFEHKRHDNIGDPFKHKYLDFDSIISIRPMGEKRVFDLQMQAPNHWFVANGLLSHNSGPLVEIYTDRLAENENATAMYPWRVYQTQSDIGGTNNPAVRFFQAQMNINELMVLYNHFSTVADNTSGIPSYAYGDSRAGGAARTSSGLAQLMGNTSKNVKRLVKHIDEDIDQPVILRQYEHNMQHHPDPTIKGDLRPVARGVAALLVKEQLQQRRNELLAATLNPLDGQIIGVDGRREMLRETFKAADMPVNKILPTKDQLALRMAGVPSPALLLGKTGPNAAEAPGAPGGTPGTNNGGGGVPAGMSPGGGTPAAPASIDQAGRPAQVPPAFRDGGMVRTELARPFPVEEFSALARRLDELRDQIAEQRRPQDTGETPTIIAIRDALGDLEDARSEQERRFADLVGRFSERPREPQTIVVEPEGVRRSMTEMGEVVETMRASIAAMQTGLLDSLRAIEELTKATRERPASNTFTIEKSDGKLKVTRQ